VESDLALMLVARHWSVWASMACSADTLARSGKRMKRTLWILPVCAVLSVTIPASIADAQIFSNGRNTGEFGEVFGAGSITCGEWLSSDNMQQQGSNWILGYWTGIAHDDRKSRLAANEQTEKKILKEISELCRKNPDWGLTNAVAHIYFDLEHGKSRR
jgi:hypothetical protein